MCMAGWLTGWLASYVSYFTFSMWRNRKRNKESKETHADTSVTVTCIKAKALLFCVCEHSVWDWNNGTQTRIKCTAHLLERERQSERAREIKKERKGVCMCVRLILYTIKHRGVYASDTVHKCVWLGRTKRKKSAAHTRNIPQSTRSYGVVGVRYCYCCLLLREFVTCNCYVCDQLKSTVEKYIETKNLTLNNFPHPYRTVTANHAYYVVTSCLDCVFVRSLIEGSVFVKLFTDYSYSLLCIRVYMDMHV